MIKIKPFKEILAGGKAFERIREFGNNRNMPNNKTILDQNFMKMCKNLISMLS